MTTLTIPADLKREMVEKLDDLPRPKFLAGKVIVCFELNCRPDGTVGDLHIETSTRESRRAS